jgi:MerR family transcriptional regulator, heat shock protein HspR
MRRARSRPRKDRDDSATPKYSITVAADLSGVPPQQLRRMEESGLIAPQRTVGKTRRYSDADLDQIGAVADLGQAGVNAMGIQRILALQDELAQLRAENAQLRAENAQLRAENAQLRRGSPAMEQPTAGAPDDPAKDAG